MNQNYKKIFFPKVPSSRREHFDHEQWSCRGNLHLQVPTYLYLHIFSTLSYTLEIVMYIQIQNTYFKAFYI